MLDEDDIPVPKPLVDYIRLPDEEYNIQPDILDKFEGTGKIPFDFGRNKSLINKEIKEEIHNFHKVKEPEKIFIPNEIDLEEENNVGPAIPKSLVNEHMMQIEDQSGSSDDEQIRIDLEKQIPTSHVVELKHTEGKGLNCLDIDRSGNRLVTGSYDGTIKIWDFTSMTRRPNAFHTVDAGEGYSIQAVSWAPSGGFFVAATGDCQAKVYSRDGDHEIGCLKGDSYLHDIANTKGHTFPLTDAKWHPNERAYFITSARDSTVRIWDINSKPMGLDQELMQIQVLKAKTFKNHKIPINSICYSHDGNIIASGVNDGSLQFWTSKNYNWKPSMYIQDAHAPGTEITSLLFCEDNQRLFSRGDDSTLKMWDIRNSKKPIHVWDNLPSFASKTGITISPDESIVVTGTSVKKGHDNSSLIFLSTYNYEKIKEQRICNNSVVPLLWDHKLNQIAVGTSDGTCHMFFSPDYSKSGIVNSIYKKAKTREVDDVIYSQPIITPLVLPLFDEVNFDRKTLYDKIGPEAATNLKLDLPEQGEGSKFYRPPSVTQYIMKQLHKKTYKEKDVRDMLTEFDRKDINGNWVDSAYANNAKIFDHKGLTEAEAVYYEESKRKKCAGCGLKFCTCNKNIFQFEIPKLSAAKKYTNF